MSSLVLIRLLSNSSAVASTSSSSSPLLILPFTEYTRVKAAQGFDLCHTNHHCETILNLAAVVHLAWPVPLLLRSKTTEGCISLVVDVSRCPRSTLAAMQECRLRVPTSGHRAPREARY
ncbi:uncharacterized protein LY79DRAFT_9794 [Colletotrichum navitas]|uniref:Secreted protein n=1 Tax=Colletotrichum navitas TaxID=681940 RepID=A0AAD8VD39_9PEZI|nr:uncharacterized protein LY79DRAFT_9794 [Colletotrichum navitas]KAK1600170.1 hypothetical protein LY79DRAFT_9794 [Colletotrichum navitas]